MTEMSVMLFCTRTIFTYTCLHEYCPPMTKMSFPDVSTTLSSPSLTSSQVNRGLTFELSH